MKGITLKAAFDTILLMVKNQEPLEEIEEYMKKISAQASLDDMRVNITNCINCNLCEGGKVPGEGNSQSDIMIVGEAPGEHEEKLGRPFVGPSGQLLDRIIGAAGWNRSRIYLTNIIKCRPSHNGKNIQPNARQIAACSGHLKSEINAIKPRVVICLGSVAANTLIHPKFKITEEHGRWFEISQNVKAIAIYHPSYILYKGEGTQEQEDVKFEVWEDIQKVIQFLGGVK